MLKLAVVCVSKEVISKEELVKVVFCSYRLGCFLSFTSCWQNRVSQK